MGNYDSLGLFGKLPRELRDAIYDEYILDCTLTLKHDTIFWKYVCSANTAFDSPSVCDLPALARTCKSIYTEMRQACEKVKPHITNHRSYVKLDPSAVWAYARPCHCEDNVPSAQSFHLLIDARLDCKRQCTYPADIAFRNYVWAREVISSAVGPFSKVKRLAIEVDLGTCEHAKDPRHQICLRQEIKDALLTHRCPQTLESFSILMRPGMIGSWEVKAGSGWIYKSNEAILNNCTNRKGGMLNGQLLIVEDDAGWLQFLQSMNASETFRRSIDFQSEERQRYDRLIERLPKCSK